MRWQGRRQSGNIEDRRGTGAGGLGGGFGRMPMGYPTTRRAGGGLGIGAVAVILLVAWLAGVNPLDMLLGGSGIGSSSIITEDSARTGAPSDEAGQFVATVLADTEDNWTKILAAQGIRYQPPTLVLFSNATQSACGYASTAAGPFYCPNDRKVYIDLAFYRELRTKFNAPGDFAEAYVIAHEIGHHVQNQLGLLRGKLGGGADSAAVRTELQADCFAGIWAHGAESEDILDIGDIDEALNAAAQIGDDTLQRRTQGYAVPDSFTHGTSAQRSRWFKRGYETGELAGCDTFNANSL
jgi:predicted metalloprotease